MHLCEPGRHPFPKLSVVAEQLRLNPIHQPAGLVDQLIELLAGTNADFGLDRHDVTDVVLLW